MAGYMEQQATCRRLVSMFRARAQRESTPFTRLCPPHEKLSKSALVRRWRVLVSPFFHHPSTLPLRRLLYSALAVAEKRCGDAMRGPRSITQVRDHCFWPVASRHEQGAALNHPSQPRWRGADARCPIRWPGVEGPETPRAVGAG